MTKEELGKLYPLFLEPYNPQWPCLFENEKRVLSGFFSENLRIEHIGSTAIVGMPAKPT
ncbi:MAG: GrpB family protein, partial [Spirochaetales bacterium]|nr:GrpB family protein [Spirochaetales bacterium]